jgi:hypothetical protein
MTPAEYEVILEKARAVQVKQVMPLIGPLLDMWDDLPNDTKGAWRVDAPTLCTYLDKLDEAMCADIGNEK